MLPSMGSQRVRHDSDRTELNKDIVIKPVITITKTKSFCTIK